jgi:hypothetical protein
MGASASANMMPYPRSQLAAEIECVAAGAAKPCVVGSIHTCGGDQNFGGYFSWVEIELKVLFSFVPMPFTTAMIAMEMPAAISPYSIAVAADSSLMNARIFARMGNILASVFKTTVKPILEKSPDRHGVRRHGRGRASVEAPPHRPRAGR